MHLVRIKPLDPRKGHRLQTFVDSTYEGKRYVTGNLYEVTPEEAVHLSWFMQDGTRVSPETVVYDKARAFDVFPSREAARAVLEDETRGQLAQPSLNKVFRAPGRTGAEDPIPTGTVGKIRSAPEVDAPASDAPITPPTALERRRAAADRASARARKTG